MNKEQKYISLPFAQELQEVAEVNNIKLPESEYYWVEHRQWKKIKNEFKEIKPIYKLEPWGSLINSIYFKAYDVAELGMILPNRIIVHISKSYRDWFIKVIRISKKEMILNNPGIEFLAQTEANARCKCLIYLIKNKLL